MVDTTELLRSHFRKTQNTELTQEAKRVRQAFLRDKAVRSMTEPDFLKPDWARYANPYFPLSLNLLFTLSTGINPACACFEQDGEFDAFLYGATVTENKDVLERMNAYTRRWEQFAASSGHPETPKAWPESDYPHRPLLRPMDFAKWAVAVGWELPEGFPGTDTPVAGQLRPARLPKACASIDRADDLWRSRFNAIRRKDNLWRAIGEALESGKVTIECTAADFMEYLAKEDESGHVRSKNGDSIEWINSSGEESLTGLKAFNNRLSKLRGEAKKQE